MVSGRVLPVVVVGSYVASALAVLGMVFALAVVAFGASWWWLALALPGAVAAVVLSARVRRWALRADGWDEGLEEPWIWEWDEPD